jgi:hypothetical protein
MAASPKRPTTMEQSSSPNALMRDPTKLQPSDYTATFTRFPNDIKSLGLTRTVCCKLYIHARKRIAHTFII